MMDKYWQHRISHEWDVAKQLSFTEEVKEYAHGAGVRLIEGIDFAKMVIDTGVNSINDVIKITE